MIASNVEGLCDIISTSRSAGLLVDPKDSSMIADALAKLIESAELRNELGSNGFERSQDYSEMRMLEGYQKLYTSFQT